jgi:hypothetical protein
MRSVRDFVGRGRSRERGVTATDLDQVALREAGLSLLQRVDPQLVADELADAAVLLAEARCQKVLEGRAEQVRAHRARIRRLLGAGALRSVPWMHSRRGLPLRNVGGVMLPALRWAAGHKAPHLQHRRLAPVLSAP